MLNQLVSSGRLKKLILNDKTELFFDNFQNQSQNQNKSPIKQPQQQQAFIPLRANLNSIQKVIIIFFFPLLLFFQSFFQHFSTFFFFFLF